MKSNPVSSTERQRRFRARRLDKHGLKRHELWITPDTEEHWAEIKEKEGLERIRELVAWVLRREVEQIRGREGGTAPPPRELFMTPSMLAIAGQISSVDGIERVRHGILSALQNMCPEPELTDGSQTERDGEETRSSCP